MKFEENKAVAIEIANAIKKLKCSEYFEISIDSDGGYIEVDGVEYYFDENANFEKANISL